MIRVYYSPTFYFLNIHKIHYEFEGERIIVTYKYGDDPLIQDDFDFSNFNDGRIETDGIETIIPLQPISNAFREDGILYIELTNFIGEDASDFEKFPNWIEV